MKCCRRNRSHRRRLYRDCAESVCGDFDFALWTLHFVFRIVAERGSFFTNFSIAVKDHQSCFGKIKFVGGDDPDFFSGGEDRDFARFRSPVFGSDVESFAKFFVYGLRQDVSFHGPCPLPFWKKSAFVPKGSRPWGRGCSSFSTKTDL